MQFENQYLNSSIKIKFIMGSLIEPLHEIIKKLINDLDWDETLYHDHEHKHLLNISKDSSISS